MALGFHMGGAVNIDIIKDIILYDNGTFSSDYPFTTSTTYQANIGSSTVTLIGNNYIDCYASQAAGTNNTQAGTAITSLKIDLTNYRILEVIGTASIKLASTIHQRGMVYAGIYSNVNPGTSITGVKYTSSTNANVMMSLDISDLSGEYYVGAGAYTYQSYNGYVGPSSTDFKIASIKLLK